MGLKRMVFDAARSMVRPLGLDLVRMQSGEYSPHFSPWTGGVEAEFDAVFEPAWEIANWAGGRPDAKPMMRERMFVLYWAARRAARLAGDFIECGVYRGGTALVACASAGEALAGRTFHLFDTFEGTPDRDLADSEKGFERRRSDTSVDIVRSHLSAYADVVDIHPGYVPETFDGLEIARVAYAHIDINTAAATYESLRFVYERLAPGAVVLFDDYGWRDYVALKERIDEYLAERGEKVLPLRCGTGMLVKS